MAKPPQFSGERQFGCLPVCAVILAFFAGWMAGRGSRSGSRVARQVGISTSAVSIPTVAPTRPVELLPLGVTGKGVSAIPDNGRRLVGKVVGIANGDTITLLSLENRQVKIRLGGIDTPESSQEYATKSMQALSVLIGGKETSATVTGVDRYGRFLAWLDVDGTVNRRMVADRLGLAIPPIQKQRGEVLDQFKWCQAQCLVSLVWEHQERPRISSK